MQGNGTYTKNAHAELPAFVSIGRVKERLFALTQLLRPQIGRHLEIRFAEAHLQHGAQLRV